MNTWNGFRGAGTLLDDLDLPRIGATIGVGEDELHAFMEVESRGGGFDALGRPKILFEPHKFHLHLPSELRSVAVEAGLAAPRWGAIPYGKESEQYGRLERAMRIDEEAALKSCSWGAFQIMGENHKMVGYSTVQDMVRAFMDDEEHHLAAAVAFIQASGIDDDLRNHRWAVVARVYNGPGYRKNRYDEKMAKAFARWRGIKDTPWAPGEAGAHATTVPASTGAPPAPAPDGSGSELAPAPPSPGTTPRGRPASSAGARLPKWEIEGLQKKLRELGYFEVGKVDGVWGGRTAGALAAFQHDHGLTVDGIYGPRTKAALETAVPRKPSPVRAAATVDDVRRQGSSTIAAADRVTWGSKLLGLGSAAVAAGTFVAQNWAEAEALVAPFRPLLGWVPPWAYPVPVIAGAAYLYLGGDQVKLSRLRAEQSGMHNGEPDPAPSPPVEHAPEPMQGLQAVIEAGLAAGRPFGMPRPPRR